MKRLSHGELLRDRALRALVVIPGSEDDAIGMSFSRRQAKAIAPCGFDVRSFYLRSRTSPLTIWKELRRLRNEIRVFQPDIVHAHFGTMTAFVCAIASGKPLVITFHGSDLNPAPGEVWLKSKMGRMLSRLAMVRASQAICVSPQLRDRIAHYGDRVHLLPCGVDLGKFRPMAKTECRQTLGWSVDEPVVLFNARTDPIGKRLDLAEAAFGHAKRLIPNLRLHVFRGKTHPDEMPLYYNAADCLLMTSDYEGSPMVVKEAMACDLPVVSVDVGDVAERLSNVRNSVIVARDPSAIGEAMVRFLELGQPSNGREMMQALSEQNIARRVAGIYHLAANEAKACPLPAENALVAIEGRK